MNRRLRDSEHQYDQYEGRKDVAGIVTHPSFLLTVNASSSGRIYCKNFFRINYTREEAGRWTLMMKNMGNWSRLEKGNGMGLHQTAADEDTEGEQETGSKTQVTGSRKLDTRHRTQGNITLASQTSDKDTQWTQETGFRIQGT